VEFKAKVDIILLTFPLKLVPSGAVHGCTEWKPDREHGENEEVHWQPFGKKNDNNRKDSAIFSSVKCAVVRHWNWEVACSLAIYYCFWSSHIWDQGVMCRQIVGD